MSWKIAIGSALAAATLAGGTPSSAQQGVGYGPPPTEQEFHEAANRAVHRLFRSRIVQTEWREPRRGAMLGHGGYIACGDVTLRGRPDDPVTVAAVWRRGDVQPLLVNWRYDSTDPFANQMDMPLWLVMPSPGLPDRCAAFSGGAPAEGQAEGERFDWSPALAAIASWREVRRETRRLDEPDDFGRVAECIRIRTREGRRYRVRVEASFDTSLSILTDRDCSDGVLRWNENASAADLNPLVEFDAPGAVYAYVRVAPGRRGGPYELTVEEANEP